MDFIINLKTEDEFSKIKTYNPEYFSIWRVKDYPIIGWCPIKDKLTDLEFNMSNQKLTQDL